MDGQVGVGIILKATSIIAVTLKRSSPKLSFYFSKKKKKNGNFEESLSFGTLALGGYDSVSQVDKQ